MPAGADGRTDGPGPRGFGVLSAALRAARPLRGHCAYPRRAPRAGRPLSMPSARAGSPARGGTVGAEGEIGGSEAQEAERRRRPDCWGARARLSPPPTLKHTRALQERPHASGEGARDREGRREERRGPDGRPLPSPTRQGAGQWIYE